MRENDEKLDKAGNREHDKVENRSLGEWSNVCPEIVMLSVEIHITASISCS